MRDLYGFDDHDFIQAARQRACYVADKSDANHVSTTFSLASSLDMATLPHLGTDLPPGTYPAPLTDPIRNSLVGKQLEHLGCRTVTLPSGWSPTSIKRPPSSSAGSEQLGAGSEPEHSSAHFL